MNPGLNSAAKDNERVLRILSYILVYLMMVCGVMIAGILIHNVLPAWHTAVIAGAALFVVMDRMYMHRQLKSWIPFSTEWVISLCSQWIVILLMIRLLLSYASGLDTLRTELSLFARGYLEKFFTPEYIVSLLLAFLVWYLASRFLELIDEIGLDQEVALSEVFVRIDVNQVPAHQRLINLIFTLGIGLVILAAFTRMDINTLISTPGRIPKLEFSRFSGAEAGAMLYFVFGLALLSLSRLMSLQKHWNRRHIPVTSKSLVRQWGLYSLVFFLLLAFIVGLLPAGDSIGFLSLVVTLFAFLIQVIVFIIQLVAGLVLFLFSLPFLFFKVPPPVVIPLRRIVPPAPVEPVAPVAGNEYLLLIRSLFLWGLVIFFLFSFLYFLRRHGGILPALRRSRFMNWLVQALQWLYASLEKTGGNFSRLLSEAWQNMAARRDAKRVFSPVGWITVRGLDPRRKVFFFYLALVRRSGERNLERRPSQTPSEYAGTLEKAMPAEEGDIDLMTRAFEEARYSRHVIDPTRADNVKTAWGKVRRALQEKPRGKSRGR